MRELAYLRAADAATAVAAVAEHPNAVFLAGGTNLVDHLKLGITAPELLVDVRGLPLDDIVEHDGPDGPVLCIGAAVRNSDLAAHPQVRSRVPAVARALLAGASPQIRHQATTGGNLLQRTRCVYFQDATTPCNKREPGTGCSALEGYGRYNAVLGASDDCVAVHPSDLAVALAAVDAVVVVLGVDGERRVPLVDLHRLPGDRPDLDTTLARGDLVTSVELPADRPGPAIDVRQGPRPGVLRVRAGLGGRRPRPRRRHRPRRPHRLGRHRPQALAGHPRGGPAPWRPADRGARARGGRGRARRRPDHRAERLEGADGPQRDRPGADRARRGGRDDDRAADHPGRAALHRHRGPPRRRRREGDRRGRRTPSSTAATRARCTLAGAVAGPARPDHPRSTPTPRSRTEAWSRCSTTPTRPGWRTPPTASWRSSRTSRCTSAARSSPWWWPRPGGGP